MMGVGVDGGGSHLGVKVHSCYGWVSGMIQRSII